MFLNCYNITTCSSLNPQFENSNRDRRIHSRVVRHHVWDSDKDGLPYLEIVKGWLKDSIFTRQHKMVHELLSSARQSKMHILKSSGFWFYNIITHWGHPGKGRQKLKQNRNVEAKNWESNRTVIIVINREFD